MKKARLICKCFAIDAVMIEEMVWANKLRTVEDVTNFTKAGGGCASCHEDIEAILEKVLAEKGEKFDPNAAPVEQTAKVAAVKAPLTNLQRIKKIEQVLESLRPALMADGGDVELVEVIGNTAYVNMTGACNGCQMAAMTIAGIQQRLMEVMGEFIKVVPATEMSKLVSIEAGVMTDIYLDNNATTRVDPAVVDVMIPYFLEQYGNPSSIHKFADGVARGLKQARQQVQALIGCEHDSEIIFTSCGTESNSTAILSAIKAQPNKKEIITTTVEHPAILSVCDYLEKDGYTIHRMPVDKAGRLNLECL